MDAPTPYPDMLRKAGWDIVEHINLTIEYLESIRRNIAGLKTYEREITETFGKEEASEKLARKLRTTRALENGFLRRELLEVVPTKP